MKRQIIRTSLLALLLAGTAAMHAQAEVVQMPEKETSAAPAKMPSRGMTQASVTARYGQPASRMAPVGQPPITRWIYDKFTVYFEGDHVIHSVVHHN